MEKSNVRPAFQRSERIGIRFQEVREEVDNERRYEHVVREVDRHVQVFLVPTCVCP